MDQPYHPSRIDEIYEGELVSYDPEISYVKGWLNFMFFLTTVRASGLAWRHPRFAWFVDEHNVFKPDFLFGQPENLVEATGFTDVTPDLVIDVVRLPGVHDERRLSAYTKAGLTRYWIADPAVPSITIYELAEGRFSEREKIRGDESRDIEEPFPVKLCPATQLVV